MNKIDIIKIFIKEIKGPNIIENGIKPTLFPPRLLLNVGVKIRLFYERYRAKTEI